MRNLNFVDLLRINKIIENQPKYCIPTTAEIILNYYGENKWTREHIYKKLTKQQDELNFQGFIRRIGPLLKDFDVQIQSHNGDIQQLTQFVKKNIDEKNPIFSAVKSDYAKSSGESGNLFKSKTTYRGISIELILFTDNNAQSKNTHIVPIIGYSDQHIFIYEFNEGVVFGADYTNNIFRQITQVGSFNTMTIKPKNV